MAGWRYVSTPWHGIPLAVTGAVLYGLYLTQAGVPGWFGVPEWTARLTGAVLALASYWLAFVAYFMLHRPNGKDVLWVATVPTRSAPRVVAVAFAKPDKRRRAQSGDVRLHTAAGSRRYRSQLDTTTRQRVPGAGERVLAAVRDDTRAKGGRVTGTALPGMAKVYKKHGMVEESRQWLVLIRIVDAPIAPATPTHHL